MVVLTACGGASSGPDPAIPGNPAAAGAPAQHPGGRPAALAELLLAVECQDVVDGAVAARWWSDAVVVRGRLGEPGPHDVALRLPDAIRAGLPLTRLPTGPAGASPCRVGAPPPRPAEEGGDPGGLAAFAAGRLHLEVREISPGPGGALRVTSRITVDYLGTRQRFGTRHVLRRGGAGVDEGGLVVVERRSWLERSAPSTLDGIGAPVVYDAGYYASLDHGVARARARGDLGCEIARMAEGRRWRELVAVLDDLDREERFPYWSLYVSAAETTGQFRKANDYRAWVSASVDDRAARRAAVGNLVDRCQRRRKGSPKDAATLASDGPCTDDEAAALGAGTAVPELFCHPPRARVEMLARRFRSGVARCVADAGVGGAGSAYEARLVIHQNGVVRVAALGRVAAPREPSERVDDATRGCADRAARTLPSGPFRLRPAEGARAMPTWEVQAEILVP